MCKIKPFGMLCLCGYADFKASANDYIRASKRMNTNIKLNVLSSEKLNLNISGRKLKLAKKINYNFILLVVEEIKKIVYFNLMLLILTKSLVKNKELVLS